MLENVLLSNMVATCQKTLTQEVSIFNQTGQEYKIESNTFHIRNNIVVKIIQKYKNDKKTSVWDE